MGPNDAINRFWRQLLDGELTLEIGDKLETGPIDQIDLGRAYQDKVGAEWKAEPPENSIVRKPSVGGATDLLGFSLIRVLLYTAFRWDATTGKMEQFYFSFTRTTVQIMPYWKESRLFSV